MLRKLFMPLVAGIFLRSALAFAHGDNTTFSSDVQQAAELYSCGQYDASLAVLDKETKDPAALFLIGRDYYMSAEFKKATQYIKRAVIAAPTNSEYMDWLGRAYEKRAGDSNLLSAAIFTKKARLAYERAVELNAKNSEALSDLFRFYLDSPAFLGGSYVKAETVAEKMSAVNPELARLAQWRLLQKLRASRNAEEPGIGSDN